MWILNTFNMVNIATLMIQWYVFPAPPPQWCLWSFLIEGRSFRHQMTPRSDSFLMDATECRSACYIENYSIVVWPR